MRIKKKYVLLESRLIDVSSEFTPQEKRILEMLFKKYGLSASDFNMWTVAVELIEDFNLDYETAYSLARTYSWSARELFSEFQPIRKTMPSYKLFFENLSNLIESYSKSNENSYTVRLKFDGDVGTETLENRQVSLNSGFRGFYMYIPIEQYIETPYRRYYIDNDDHNVRTLSTTINFNPIDLNGEIRELSYFSSDENDDVNTEEFMVSVQYRNVAQSIYDDSLLTKLMQFKVPYPKPLTKENILNTFDSLIKDILDYMSNTTFDLPEGAKPINVNDLV